MSLLLFQFMGGCGNESFRIIQKMFRTKLEALCKSAENCLHKIENGFSPAMRTKTTPPIRFLNRAETWNFEQSAEMNKSILTGSLEMMGVVYGNHNIAAPAHQRCSAALQSCTALESLLLLALPVTTASAQDALLWQSAHASFTARQ